MSLVEGTLLFLPNTSPPSELVAGAASSPSTSMVVAPPALSQLSATGKGKTSCTSKSRTLKTGLSMAHCSAQPRATHSLALSVRLTSRLNTSCSVAQMAGTRLPEPTTSRLEICSTVRPQSDSAFSQGARARLSVSAQICSKSSRLTLALTSISLARHSTLRVASGLALRIFFIFSISLSRRPIALVLPSTSPSPFFSSANLRAKCSAMARSKSRPPRLASHAWLSTLSSPFLKATTDT
mmetsp:Transcript_11891/g.36707  ORF Transcript_11891/g.36707 Transcript_11891/m.36707 type:complete len:239 (-) Transcript_11891:679-1395(-)